MHILQLLTLIHTFKEVKKLGVPFPEVFISNDKDIFFMLAGVIVLLLLQQVLISLRYYLNWAIYQLL